MKKIVIAMITTLVLIVCIAPNEAKAESGCCSNHGGVFRCLDGRVVCHDITFSLCRC